MSKHHFNPEFSRERLLDPIGGYEWSLQSDMEGAKHVGGIGPTADSNSNIAAECLFVGFDEPAKRLLRRAVEWVQIAIESNERPQHYFPGATEAGRFQTLAQCNWLLHGQHDINALQRFVENKDRYLNSQKRKDKIGVSLGILTYVNAGAFERTLEIIESTPRLALPTSLTARNEAQMAYILSRHHLGLQYSPSEVHTATTRFLKRNIDTWLSNGHSDRAAEWLKIIYWNDSDRALSPKQVLMKAYDYLPGRVPPE